MRLTLFDRLRLWLRERLCHHDVFCYPQEDTFAPFDVLCKRCSWGITCVPFVSGPDATDLADLSHFDVFCSCGALMGLVNVRNDVGTDIRTETTWRCTERPPCAQERFIVYRWGDRGGWELEKERGGPSNLVRDTSGRVTNVCSYCKSDLARGPHVGCFLR